jgi:hypothetical protein
VEEGADVELAALVSEAIASSLAAQLYSWLRREFASSLLTILLRVFRPSCFRVFDPIRSTLQFDVALQLPGLLFGEHGFASSFEGGFRLFDRLLLHDIRHAAWLGFMAVMVVRRL